MRAKTVNEAMSFSRKDDPKGSLGIGMMGQLKALAKERGKDIENMDDVGFFLVAAWDKRHDLMDYLITKGLDINSQEHEILRVLGWWEYVDLGIHLIQKRGADLEGAIKDANAHNEWKTVRRLEEMKEKIESTRPTPVYEVQNFERGQDPKAAMDLGGIKFTTQLYEFVNQWEENIQKTLQGRTITAVMRELKSDGNEGATKKQTITVKEIDNIYTLGYMGENNSNWHIVIIADNKKRYNFFLDQKIYIK
jgi:hypothetical protein